ncbi:MAG: hypothetical protein WCD11_24625 [Solirubrobacteraceae bacterium]
MFALNRRTLSAAAVIAALSAPATSSAMINGDPGAPTAAQRQSQGEPSWQQIELQAYQRSVEKSFGATPGGLAGPVVRGHTADATSVRPARVSSQGGFQWDDAGIGAAGILALLGLGAGSVTAITRRRTHPTRVS